MVKIIISVVAYIILAPVAGGILTGITDKTSARVQGRKGGSIVKPISYVIALFQRSSREKGGIQRYYIKVSLFFNLVAGGLFFAGIDLLMTIACLGLAIIFLVLAANASGTYYARIGADRLVRQMVAAAPIMMMVAIGFYVLSGSFDTDELLSSGPVAVIPMMGIFAGYIFIPCAKMRKSGFDHLMPHGMYQKDMSSLADAFGKRDAAFCEIGSWYEKVTLYAILFAFFADGSLIMTAAGAAACLATAVLQGLIENRAPLSDDKRSFKTAWIASLILGILNLMVIYIIM